MVVKVRTLLARHLPGVGIVLLSGGNNGGNKGGNGDKSNWG